MRNAVIIIIVVLVLGLVAAYFLGAFNPGAPTVSAPLATTPLTSTPSHTPSFSPLLSITPAVPAIPTGPANVTFDLLVTGITGSGLSRTVTADISNAGTTDAHNVTATLEVFSAGSRVQVSGKNSLSVNVGTLKAGMTVTRQVTMDFGIFDGMKLQQSGAQVVLTITSDEKSQVFNYDFKP